MTTLASTPTTYHVTRDAWDTVARVVALSHFDAIERALESRGIPFGPSRTIYGWFRGTAPTAAGFRVDGIEYTVEAMR